MSGSMPAERQRDAELVVVVRLRGDRAQVRRAERGQDVLRRRLAGRAGDADDAGAAAVAHRAADRRERRVGVVGDERGGGTAGERVRDEVGAAADRDEEVALLDPARVDLHAGHLVGPGARGQAAERLEQGELERDHGRATAASTSRATSRSSKGRLPVASSCSGSAPRPAIDDDVARSRLGERELDRGAAVELDLELAGRARRDLGGDRRGVLGARVVGGEDRPVGEPGDDLRPSAGACRGRGRRRRRRRPSAGRRRARAPRGARCSSESGVCA